MKKDCYNCIKMWSLIVSLLTNSHLFMQDGARAGLLKYFSQANHRARYKVKRKNYNNYTVASFWMQRSEVILAVAQEIKISFMKSQIFSEIVDQKMLRIDLYCTYWLVWRSSISRMTPFSWSLAAVYFSEVCFSFLLPFTSSFPSNLIDLREFLEREQENWFLMCLSDP